MLLGFILGILFEKELQKFREELEKAIIKELRKENKVRKITKIENRRRIKKSK